MNVLKTEKNLTIANFIVVAYFIVIYLIYYFQIKFVLIGVFQELLTIPFLLGQLVLLFLGIRFLIKEKRFRLLYILSFIALIGCVVLTIGRYLFTRIGI